MKVDRNGVPHNDRGLWPEGVSGNPNGRPKRTTEERIRQVISDETSDDDLRDIWRAAVEGAKKGDKGDREFIARYSWPRPAEHIELTATAKPEIDLMLGAFGMDIEEPAQLGEGDNGPSED